MPRTNIGIPQRAREIENDLRGRYGGMLTLAQITRELGVSKPSALRWVEDVKAVIVNDRKKYPVANVARKIYQNEV